MCILYYNTMGSASAVGRRRKGNDRYRDVSHLTLLPRCSHTVVIWSRLSLQEVLKMTTLKREPAVVVRKRSAPSDSVVHGVLFPRLLARDGPLAERPLRRSSAERARFPQALVQSLERLHVREMPIRETFRVEAARFRRVTFGEAVHQVHIRHLLVRIIHRRRTTLSPSLLFVDSRSQPLLSREQTGIIHRSRLDRVIYRTNDRGSDVIHDTDIIRDFVMFAQQTLLLIWIPHILLRYTLTIKNSTHVIPIFD